MPAVLPKNDAASRVQQCRKQTALFLQMFHRSTIDEEDRAGYFAQFETSHKRLGELIEQAKCAIRGYRDDITAQHDDLVSVGSVTACTYSEAVIRLAENARLWFSCSLWLYDVEREPSAGLLPPPESIDADAWRQMAASMVKSAQNSDVDGLEQRVEREWRLVDDKVRFTEPRSPSEWCEVFGRDGEPISLSTWNRMIDADKVRVRKETTKKVRVAIADLPSKLSPHEVRT